MPHEIEILQLFEAGELPEEIYYLYRKTELIQPQQIINIVESVEPVKSPLTGTLSAFLFSSKATGDNWLQEHSRYSRHLIKNDTTADFFEEINDLRRDREKEIESLSLWIKTPDGWQEHCKQLSDYV